MLLYNEIIIILTDRAIKTSIAKLHGCMINIITVAHIIKKCKDWLVTVQCHTRIRNELRHAYGQTHTYKCTCDETST